MRPLLAQRPSVDRAFERIYRRHVGDVYRYALVVLRNPADAEDVTQTTFMNAYRAFKGGEQPRTAQNWLIAIAHNVCRQRFRQSARRPAEVAFDEEIGDGTFEEEQGPSAEDIQRALGHLAFNQRAALVMRELEGRSYAEIAEILDLSVSAVETLLFRARRALREQLEGSLTCGEAELAISKQMDGRLPRTECGPLRAHLRECQECAHFARSQRAQRAALKSLGALPLPVSLASFFGGGGTAAGTGLAVKAAAMLATGAVVAGTGYEVARGPIGAWQEAAPAGAQPAERQDAGAVASLGAAFARAGLERPGTAGVGRPASEQGAGKGRGQAKAKQKGQGAAGAETRTNGRGHQNGVRVKSNQGRSAAAHATKPKQAKKAKSSRKPKPAKKPKQEAGSGGNGADSGNSRPAEASGKKPEIALPVVQVPALPPAPELPFTTPK